MKNLCLAVWFVLSAGCAKNPESIPARDAIQTKAPAAASQSVESEKSERLTVTDGLGRVVIVPRTPVRMISLAPRNTEILFAVGAGDQVVGVTEHCNFPLQAQKRERVGGFSAESLSLEKIVGLQPDLVISADEIHRSVITQLERLGIPVVALGAGSLAGLYGEIEMLGRITGHEQNAAHLAAEMQERVEQVRRRGARIPPEKRVTVYYQVWDDPLTAAGPATFIGEMIELCGAINIVNDPEATYAEISEEIIVARNPDVILAPSVHAGAVTREQFSERPGFGGLRAVKNDRVHLIEGDIISRCGPRLVDALEIMSRCLYPEPAP